MSTRSKQALVCMAYLYVLFQILDVLGWSLANLRPEAIGIISAAWAFSAMASVLALVIVICLRDRLEPKAEPTRKQVR